MQRSRIELEPQCLIPAGRDDDVCDVVDDGRDVLDVLFHHNYIVQCTYYKPHKLITFAGGDDEKDDGGDVHDHIHCQP